LGSKAFGCAKGDFAPSVQGLERRIARGDTLAGG
jgi:hypothetical protein